MLLYGALTLWLFSLPSIAAHLLPAPLHPQGKPPLPHFDSLFRLAILHSDRGRLPFSWRGGIWEASGGLPSPPSSWTGGSSLGALGKDILFKEFNQEIHEFSPKKEMTILTCWFQKPIRLVSPPEDITASLVHFHLPLNITLTFLCPKCPFQSLLTADMGELTSLDLTTTSDWGTPLTLTGSSCAAVEQLVSHYQSQVCLKLANTALEWSLFWTFREFCEVKWFDAKSVRSHKIRFVVQRSQYIFVMKLWALPCQPASSVCLSRC